MPLTFPTDQSPPDGCLYIVATPIGNPEDITLRALKVLKEVDLIAAEDTRQTGLLLNHYDISQKMISYHEYNEEERTPQIIDLLLSGKKIALVSDAGTPLLSDPGYRLSREAANRRISIVPLPGACAAVAALSASGLPTDRFLFVGFPPKKKGKLALLLSEIADGEHTTVFYESPKRICSFISELLKTMGDREAVLSREITKPHEEFIRGKLSEIRNELQKRNTIRGECTLIVSSMEQEERSIENMERIKLALTQNDVLETENISELSRMLAKEYKIPKKQIYEYALELKKNKEHEKESSPVHEPIKSMKLFGSNKEHQKTVNPISHTKKRKCKK